MTGARGLEYNTQHTVTGARGLEYNTQHTANGARGLEYNAQHTVTGARGLEYNTQHTVTVHEIDFKILRRKTILQSLYMVELYLLGQQGRAISQLQ